MNQIAPSIFGIQSIEPRKIRSAFSSAVSGGAKKSGKPAVLTVNGAAELVVQSAGAYQKLLDDRELLESIRGIGRGVEQSKQGEGRPMREFLEELAREFKLSLK